MSHVDRDLLSRITSLDGSVKEFWDIGRPLVRGYQGRPSYDVASLFPFHYKRYGLGHRAPYIAGPVAVRGLIVIENRLTDVGAITPGYVFGSLGNPEQGLHADHLRPEDFVALGDAAAELSEEIAIARAILMLRETER
jgi:hypothetical protein